jgi:hypothetical protein
MHPHSTLRTLVAAIAASSLLTAGCGLKESTREELARLGGSGLTPGSVDGLTPDGGIATGAGPASGTVTGTETGIPDTAAGAEAVGAVPGSADGSGSSAGISGGAGARSDTTSSGSEADPAARSALYGPDEDTTGITDKQITMCAHAALTYGKAFHTEADDFNVYWTALNNKGGIYGRKMVVSYENDNYNPTDAVVAARACNAKKPFLLLGGIGFDATVGVRNYAEQEGLLYLHHSAPFSNKYKYSFTSLPTTERVGEGFAQMMFKKYKGKKLGIIKRDGANFEIGIRAFKSLAQRRGGIEIVAERKVPQNKANYTDEILEMRNKGAEVVWIWENSLTAIQVIKQMKAQNFAPPVMVVSANIISQTLGEDALNPVIDGVEFFTAYSYRDYTGPFAAYADDMKLFEAQYGKYRPNVDLNGVGGDLLFLNWTAQKSLHDILLACGPDCTRNRFIDTLATYRKRPTSSSCPLYFGKIDNQHGSDMLTFMEAYRAPAGKINFRNTIHCVGPDTA